MSDLDEQITDALVDGWMTEHDADEVRNFASFLDAIADLPTPARERTPEQRRQFGVAYRKHYPEEYAQAIAEEKARRAREAT